jgi:hypothetical protein
MKFLFVILVSITISGCTARHIPQETSHVKMNAVSQWQQAVYHDNIVNYEQFLMANPNGVMANQAHKRITYLEAEQVAWQKATNEQTLESFTSYLAAFPAGPHRNTAKVFLAEHAPNELRPLLKQLNSEFPLDRGKAAITAKKGSFEPDEAAIVACFLTTMLTDLKTSLQWSRTPIPTQGGQGTSPALIAQQSLVRIGKPSVPPLLALLQDEGTDLPADYEKRMRYDVPTHIQARWLAAEALGEIRDRRCLVPFKAALYHWDAVIRNKAVEALGNIGDTSVVSTLIDALKDKYVWVRFDAVAALGKIGDFRAIEPLIAALVPQTDDEERRIPAKAAEALRKLTSQGFGQNPVKWQSWWQENKIGFSKDR